jgi:hypothetical protein
VKKTLTWSICLAACLSGAAWADCSHNVLGGDPLGANTHAAAFATVNTHLPPGTFILSDATNKAIVLPTGPGAAYIVGTPYNDFIYAPNGMVTAGLNGGYDVALLADPALAQPGKNQVVIMQGSLEGNGGKGGDLFILGDVSKRYFAGKVNLTDADNDLAYIDKFDRSTSRIRLHGNAGNYRVAQLSGLTNLSWAGSAIVTQDTCDTIAFVRDAVLTDSDLSSGIFEYASAASATTAVSTASKAMTAIDQFGSPGAVSWPGPTTAADASGNVYMVLPASTASLNGVGGTGSYFLVKYDANGNRLWTKKHGTNPGTDSASGVQVPMSIVVSGSNVFVAGLNVGPYGGAKPAKIFTGADGLDGFVAKFDSNGNLLVAKQVVPTAKTQLSPSWALAVDNNGDVFFGGSFMEGINIPLASAYVMKLKGSDLSTLWVRTFINGPAVVYSSLQGLIGQTLNTLQLTNFTAGVKFVPDSSNIPGHGSLYAAGVSDNGSFFGSIAGWNDVWYIKLDAESGANQWTGNHVCDWRNGCGYTGGYSLSTNNADTFVYGIDVDANGNLYIGGETGGTLLTSGHTESLVSARGSQLGQGDGLVVQIDPSGTVRWIKHVGSSASDKVRKLAVDGGNLYVTGDTWGVVSGSNHGQTDIYAAKLKTSDGSTLATLQLGSERIDASTALAVTSSKVFIGGFTEGSVAKAHPANGSIEAFLTSVDKSGF